MSVQLRAIKAVIPLWFILMSTGWTGVGIAAESDRQTVSPGRLADVKRDSRVFERIVGEVLRQSFTNPFAIAAEPQAAYLPGYGVVVSFHLKINRGTIRGFWGEYPNPSAEEGRTREEQLEIVRSIVLRALGDYGGTLKNLTAQERLAICAHVEDRNELNPGNSRVEIVASSAKEDIDLLMTQRISFDDFRSRVELVEY